MRKILAIVLAILGISLLVAGLSLQAKENKVKLNKGKIDYSFDHDLEEFCPSFNLEEYELRAFNYTMAKIKVPDCLKNNGNSSFLRTFASAGVSAKYEIKKIEEELSDYQNDNKTNFKLTKDEADFTYDWLYELDKDIYLNIEIKTNNIVLSDKFIKNLLKIDYSKELQDFHKTKTRGEELFAELSIIDYYVNKKYSLSINLPSGYTEESLIYADQTVELVNAEKGINISLVTEAKDSCQDYFAKDEEVIQEEEIFYTKKENKILACRALSDKVYLNVSFVNLEEIDKEIFNYKLIVTDVE